MRIGIDCRTILNPSAGEKAGVARYTYHLVKNLVRLNKLDEFVLFFDHRAKEIWQDFLEPNTVIRFFSFSQYKKYLPFVYSHILSASTLAAQRLDVYHSPANVVPLAYNRQFVVTIHDLAIYREPKLFPGRQGFSIKYLVPKSAQRAARIIAVSESTKRDIQEYLQIPPDKISVIYEGVEHERFRKVSETPKLREDLKQSFQIKKNYILFVGTLEPRKNLIRLLEAFYQLLCKRPEFKSEYQLVLVGGKGWLYQEIFEEVKNRGLANSVIFPGYLSTNELVKLYAGARLFVYPSLYEGFGLPVLEAMTAGIPVVTSNSSSLAEIAGNAALLVDPYDIEGLATSMEGLLTDENLWKQLSKLGKRRAGEFSWEQCARRTSEVYQKVRAR